MTGKDLTIVVGFVLYGGYYLMVGRAWSSYLIRLASRTTISQRRRFYNQRAVIPVVLAGLPLLALILLAATSALPKYVIPLLVAVSVAPGVLVTLRQWRVLNSLGYGAGVKVQLGAQAEVREKPRTPLS